MAPKNKGKKGKKGDDDFWYVQIMFDVIVKAGVIPYL